MSANVHKFGLKSHKEQRERNIIVEYKKSARSNI